MNSKEKSQKFMTKGVTKLTVEEPRNPAELTITGEAFPLVYRNNSVIVAGAPCGKGRIVQMGHKYFIKEDEENRGWPRLVRNIYKWLAPSICRPKVGILKFNDGESEYKNHYMNLEKWGFIVSYISISELNTVDAIFADTTTKYGEEVASKIQDFVMQQGKGMLVAGIKNKGTILSFGCGIKNTEKKVKTGEFQLLNPIE